MVIKTVSTKRGPWSFKINNSILLETEYQEKVKEAIREISNINKDANANTLLELIKGTIRNASIKYSFEKRKKHNTRKYELSNKIDKLQKDLEHSHGNSDINIVTELDNAKQQMTEILETELKVY